MKQKQVGSDKLLSGQPIKNITYAIELFVRSQW